ncbi:hypothetical protein [Micromonospora sp. C95]|uniref:hypothetical protein n=1 Tax=Micromonospora sp. C95 TaxID=2824882 RepID=UPI001B37E669|nr:hypothetical protein [Micromonospora sp. C95]MBQ1025470.1 hypothetical protein [Micromonospora sp. C95]
MSREAERTLRVEQAVLRAEQAELRADQLRLQVATLEGQIRQFRGKDQLSHERFKLWRRGIDGGWWAAIIAASYFPLTAVEPLARLVAEQRTQPDAGMWVAIAFCLVVTSGWLVTANICRLRKTKIKVQRKRLSELERELNELQKGGS